MRRSRGTAVATALLLAALAAAGCGLGPGADVGSVELTVTREFGSQPVLSSSVEANESDTVMRVLEGEAEIETRYGGGFVKSIEGTEEGRRGGRPYDWFFFVNGVESPIGAADVRAARRRADLVGLPRLGGDQPGPGRGRLLAGAVQRRLRRQAHPVAVECLGGGGACAEVRAALDGEGVALAAGDPEGAIRVLVGPWAQVREDPAAALIEDGPEESGVYAEFEQGSGGQGVGGGFGWSGSA